MLRIVSHIILSFLLLTSTIGLAVSKHFCGTDYKSIAVFEDAKSCCDMDNCCHNEQEFFHVKTDFTASQNIDTPQEASFDMLFASTFLLQNEWQLTPEKDFSKDLKEKLTHSDCLEALSLIQVYRL